MTRRCAPRWLLAAGLATLSAAAQADRPLLTDPADIAERGRCKLEPVVESLRPRGGPRTTAWLLPGACGIGWGSELAASIARSTGGGDREDAATLSGKTRLRDGGDTGVSLALGYGLGWRKPGPAGWSRDGAFVYLAATRPLAAGWTGHANLGTVHDRAGRRHTTTWGAALEWVPAEDWTLAGELTGTDRDEHRLGLGARRQLSPVWSAHAGMGAQRGAVRARQVSLGLRAEF